MQQLYDTYRKPNVFSHILAGEKDYIQSPKPSGYRGIHLVYKYKNPLAPEYDDLLIEIQIRTRLQHAWATAVETMGTFLNHALKSSSGPQYWLEYFALTASAFAHIENCNPVPQYQDMSAEDTFRNAVAEGERLKISDHLAAYSIVTEHVSKGAGGSYHLIVLDTKNQSVSVQSFGRRKLEDANLAYAAYEKQIEDGDIQVVLVATDSIESLRQAYPNYFLDTQEFLRALGTIKNLALEAL